MDRLVKAEVKEVNVVFFRGQKCSSNFSLTNLMHTMSVAVSLTTTNSSLFSFTHHPFAVIPPLSTSSFTLQSQLSDQPPISSPLDAVIVRSSMLPTGKANQEDLRRLFSKPGRHIFKDATVPIAFVGPQVVEFLLSYSPKTLEIAFTLLQAVSFCDRSQLNSLLMSASSAGNSYFVSSLIDAGADANHGDSDGVSAMSLAVRSGNADAVQILIEASFQIDNSVDRFLHCAAVMNRADIMEVLCMGCLDLDVNSVDSRRRTAVHIAATHGSVDALQFLVGVGTDPEIADRDGLTALHCAAMEGHGEAVEFLLNNSTFSKYAVTKDGKTAFALAAENDHSDLYDSLQLGDALHRSARASDLIGIRNCLSEGAKINGKDQNGWTALHRAAFKGRIECVKLLLDCGAEVDAADEDGYTPLHRAVEAGYAPVAGILIAHGARSNLKSLVGFALFDLESVKNHHSVPTIDGEKSLNLIQE